MDDFALARVIHVAAADSDFWWMRAMVAGWVIFAPMLLVIDPLHFHC